MLGGTLLGVRFSKRLELTLVMQWKWKCIFNQILVRTYWMISKKQLRGNTHYLSAAASAGHRPATCSHADLAHIICSEKSSSTYSSYVTSNLCFRASLTIFDNKRMNISQHSNLFGRVSHIPLSSLVEVNQASISLGVQHEQQGGTFRVPAQYLRGHPQLPLHLWDRAV